METHQPSAITGPDTGPWGLSCWVRQQGCSYANISSVILHTASRHPAAFSPMFYRRQCWAVLWHRIGYRWGDTLRRIQNKVAVNSEDLVLNCCHMEAQSFSINVCNGLHMMYSKKDYVFFSWKWPSLKQERAPVIISAGISLSACYCCCSVVSDSLGPHGL